MTARTAAAAFCSLLVLAACSPSRAEPTDTTFAPLLTSSTTAPSTTSTDPATTTTTTTLPPNDCAPAPTTGLDDDGFFAQSCSVLGLEIVASGDVDPSAVGAAAARIHGMLAPIPEYIDHLVAGGLTVAVIGADERITDLPPFDDLYEQYPGTDWRRAGRSFATTDLVPWIAGAEENLLCSEEDRYAGEDMLVRELARTVRDYPIRALDPTIDASIEQSYSRAIIVEGLWEDTLAENNSDTYWMEGVQSHFDANLAADPPDGAHNSVDTRDELVAYDPTLASTIEAVFGDGTWRGPCS